MILFKPSIERINHAHITQFLKEQNLADSEALYHWSINQPEKFWDAMWRFASIKGNRNSSEVIAPKGQMPGSKFFPSATLNFAENLLSRNDDHLAIIFCGEDSLRTELTYQALTNSVAQAQSLFRSLGVDSNATVAACLPNIPETVIGMLAATSLGAKFSSCSPDFGTKGILDRFQQLQPEVLLIVDGYFWKGAVQSLHEKITELRVALPNTKIIQVKFINQPVAGIPIFEELLAQQPPHQLSFEQFPFNHPLFVMFSSGTTGAPKGIIHGAGGVLLEHKKEFLLHFDLKPSDRYFYQTTCGWMMWNLLVTGLSTGATIILYDGSPFHREGKRLWDLIDEEQITIFGTSAKYLAMIEKEGLQPRVTHQLSSVHTMLSTGSPLLPESFDFVYRHVKSDILLASISGGTDIIGCFALGSPILPVIRGELQTRSYGLAVDVVNEAGESLVGTKGELVCRAPFPSMPLGFIHDPDGARYRSAYFERFPGIWHHGDFVELTPNGGLIFSGRSDATLNPGGVRIGTAEIYAQVESIPEVVESVAIGQEWDGDTRVVLFVVLKNGCVLNEELTKKIKEQIRKGASPFHVPRKIIAIPEIPRTRSGKITELAIRDVVHGKAVNNIEALANPEALKHFQSIAELQTV